MLDNSTLWQTRLKREEVDKDSPGRRSVFLDVKLTS